MRTLVLATITALALASPASAICTKTVYGSSTQAADRAQQDYLLCQQQELSNTVQNTERDAHWDAEIQALRQQVLQQQRDVFTPAFPSSSSF